jgi:hypothetical protein
MGTHSRLGTTKCGSSKKKTQSGAGRNNSFHRQTWDAVCGPAWNAPTRAPDVSLGSKQPGAAPNGAEARLNWDSSFWERETDTSFPPGSLGAMATPQNRVWRPRVPESDPIAQAALKMNHRFPGRIPARFDGTTSGRMGVDGVYVYPTSITSMVL